jgi:acetylcholinesterase/cholinesterase
VIGVTHDEAVPFIFAAFGKPLSKTEFELLLFAIFGLQNVKPLLEFYPAPANTTDYRELMTLIGTHAIFVCPNRNATRSAMSTGSTFYSYVPQFFQYFSFSKF